MQPLKLQIPRRPPDAEPIDTIPVMLAAEDAALSIAGLIVEVAAIEIAEFTVAIGGAAIGNFLNLGSGYLAARNEITFDNLSRGYSRGVVMGIDNRKGRQVATYFGYDYIPANPWDEGARQVAKDAYIHGLLRGWLEGRGLDRGQKRDLWSDLVHRYGSTASWGDSKNWSQHTWIDWYVTMAAVFRRYHMTH
jgi:hypothetical protein